MTCIITKVSREQLCVSVFGCKRILVFKIITTHVVLVSLLFSIVITMSIDLLKHWWAEGRGLQNQSNKPVILGI